MEVPQDWMPPGLTDDEKDLLASVYPNDPHRAAAEAWEAYAGTLTPSASVSSVSTGDQSVQYANGGSEYDAAVQRANWHLSRSRIRVVAMHGAPSIRTVEYGGRDWEDRGTIPTYDAGTIPPNSPVTGQP